MTPQDALAQLTALGEPEKAAEMAAYHKVERPYLGVANPQIDALYKDWRKATDVPQRIEIASFLWDSNIHEARIAAAKLLTQARIKPDQAVWDEICRWVPMFDAWAIADHACGAGARRLFLDDARLDTVESWTRDENLWVRRAAMVITLPWTKSTHPKPAELAQRERILGWAGGYVNDPEWFIQKSVSWWLRSLSKHDPDRVRQFLDDHGAAMKSFARKDAARLL
ncbi:DNA alkylation repair protein [Neptunicoccus cionae]|uniref:DNA alkylation repair protein n=1 Tax=Neptunicoccus cionae TaxID=2035344 RepID=A0A916QXX8_9RHOB|nr:DNA alkylation repair protein [Amylibacter cionae]GGA22346.1 DNA alkylation repair protein [Amylibacter cionae]